MHLGVRLCRVGRCGSYVRTHYIHGVATVPTPSILRDVHTRAKNSEEDDDEDVVPGKPMRVERLLSNLGYGKRKDCGIMVKRGQVARTDGRKLKIGEKVLASELLFQNEPLDPGTPLTILLHKPPGYVVTSPEDPNNVGMTIYDLLPYRFGQRRPFLGAVGRLDKDTSGLLILTDDGSVTQSINSPKKGIWKVYEAKLADPLVGKDAEAAARKFAHGGIILEGDVAPLLPAKLEMVDDITARLAICEGRYHQVKRMFSSIGHMVVKLHRRSVGSLSLGNLAEGDWRLATPEDLQAVCAGPTIEDVIRENGDEESTLRPTTEENFERQLVQKTSTAQNIATDEKWNRRRAALQQILPEKLS